MTPIRKDTQGDRIEASPSLLGHSNIGFTLCRYTNLMSKNQGLPADGGRDGNRRAPLALSSQIRVRVLRNAKSRPVGRLFPLRWWRGRDLNP